MSNIFQMLKQAHTMKKELGRLNEGLSQIGVEGSAGGGAVRVLMDGRTELTGVKIAPELLARGDAAAIEKLILAAAREAKEKAQRLAAAEMQKLAGAGQLPFNPMG